MSSRNVEWEIDSTFPARAEEDADISLLIGLADGVFTFILEVALKAPPEAFVHLSGETFSAFADKESAHFIAVLHGLSITKVNDSVFPAVAKGRSETDDL
ncbi:hypothetical protein Tco_0424370 [Tanacetum coccineum]